LIQWASSGAKRLSPVPRALLFAVGNETRRKRMPKMKSHQGAAGRFEVRKKGRLRRRRAGHNHILEKKSTRRKRRLNTETVVTRSDEKRIKRLMGVR
jgi:large subunit ribosomal protein L35